MRTLFALLTASILLSCNQEIDNTETGAAEEPIKEKAELDSGKELTTSQKTYALGEIDVTLIQTKSDGKEFYCKSKLLISKGNETIDSLLFTPEPVGGDYGISKPNRIEDHLVFTKHGDYDGRTIIINKQGQAFNIIGGENYFDPESKLLFTIYESDISGFAVFNMEADSVVFEMPEMDDWPLSFHKAYGERYFILSSNNVVGENEWAIWEIEFDLNRTMRVDLDTSEINQMNVLKTWVVEDVNCECEE